MKEKRVEIAASILSADFGCLNDEVKSVEKLVERLHVDVMDGHFVPNLTFGAPVMRCIKTKLPMDAHLMITNPEDFIADFAKAGADSIIVHQEVATHLSRLLEQIKSHKVRAGVSINPATPVMMLEDVIDQVDLVLVMSVNPGFGGQGFIEGALDKIAMLRAMRPDLDIHVDGGVNGETAASIIEAGANVLVSGSYIFQAKNRAAAIKKLRN